MSARETGVRSFRMVKQKNLEHKREREIMHSVRVTFHLGCKEYRTIYQTQVTDHFIGLTQLSANTATLKASHRQRRELEATLSRIKLYI